jgi:hypothetical protein
MGLPHEAQKALVGRTAAWHFGQNFGVASTKGIPHETH